MAQKLSGYDFYKSLGSPKYVVAPMVDASELPWRVLSKIYGADLCYTPMMHAKMNLTKMEADIAYRICNRNFDFFVNLHADKDLLAKLGLKDSSKIDDPLIAQFCANDPDILLSASQMVVEGNFVKAVDLNLGCPQNVAKKGHYGAFLMEEWDLVAKLIKNLHENLSVPVTAKIRVFDDVETSVKYARMIYEAGAQIITVHGRTRDMKGQNTGLADWDKIKAIRQAIPEIPIFANGNILYFRDIQRCIDYTGCDAVMVSETNLVNPCLFMPSLSLKQQLYTPEISNEILKKRFNDFEQFPLLKEHPPALYACYHYLEVCKAVHFGFHLNFIERNKQLYDPKKYIPEQWKRSLGDDHETYVAYSSIVRGHVFKMLAKIFDRFPIFRQKCGTCTCYNDYIQVFNELTLLVEQDILENRDEDWSLLTADGSQETEYTPDGTFVPNGFRILPYWVLQPLIRAPAPEDNTPRVCAQTEQKFNQTQAISSEEARNLVAIEREKRKKRRHENKIIAKEQIEMKKLKYGEQVVNTRYIKCAVCQSIGSQNCISLLCKNCCREKYFDSLRQKSQIFEEQATLKKVMDNLTDEDLRGGYCEIHSLKLVRQRLGNIDSVKKQI